MYIQLMVRRGRVQRSVKYTWIPCRFEHVVGPGGQIDENLLVNLIPRGWLPAEPREILLTVATAKGSTGLRRLTRFRPWARNFDCYVLELWAEEPHK